MHSPMTVAFDIGNQITIWHVDPETDGTDDSCGYSYPKTTKDIGKWITKTAEDEYEFFFGTKYPSERMHTASCYEVVFAIWSTISWQLDRQRILTARDLDRITSLAANPTDNVRSMVYRSKHDVEEFRRLWWCVWRARAQSQRRWYQHPKWHIRHWKIQIHAWQRFKRWAFARCAACRGRFTWGYSPTRKYVAGKGDIYHHGCKAVNE